MCYYFSDRRRFIQGYNNIMICIQMYVFSMFLYAEVYKRLLSFIKSVLQMETISIEYIKQCACTEPASPVI